MLLLNSAKTITVDGITVFPDHADPNQFWYLPAPVRLATRDEDDRKSFTFIKYKPAAVAAGVKGGGFVMFETSLRLTRAQEQRVLAGLSGHARGTPRLAVVPFDSGTVECVALNLQGAGGTSASAPAPGTFNAVEKILGAAVPSLSGDNVAAFSLSLSQEGAIILEQALTQGTTPIGVIYNLKFSGMRPALKVRIHADMKRVHDYFSASLSGQYYFVKAGIEAGLEFLRQQGVIEVDVTDFTGAADREGKEKWALELFEKQLLNDWFQPTLGPFQFPGESATTPGGNSGGNSGAAGNSGGSGATGNSGGSTGNSGNSGGSGGNSGNSGGSGSSGGSGGAADVADAVDTASDIIAGVGNAVAAGAAVATLLGEAATARPAAVLQPGASTPAAAPAGYRIEHTAAATGTTETIKVLGGSQAPTVRVGGQARSLGADRTLEIELPAGQRAEIVVEYPSTQTTREERFGLFFDFDKPPRRSSSDQSIAPQTLADYLNNNPSGSDRRFHNPPGDPILLRDQHVDHRGDGNALRAWVSRLVTPSVEIDAYASFEEHPERAPHNDRLTQRRLRVASEIVASAGASVARGAANGFNDPMGDPNDTSDDRVRYEADRVAIVRGTVAVPGDPAVTLRATLERPAGPDGPEEPEVPDRPQEPERPQVPDKPKPPAGIPGAPEIALKLRFVHQEEQKQITVVYNRSEAVQRTYAPQGFLGLMLEDLAEQDKHFVEVDLDAPFFRAFGVIVDAPIDFARIGLTSAQVALDYGRPSDALNHKHGDFIFDASSPGSRRFDVFMNASRDIDYAVSVQYHFDPTSGWDGRRFSYELPTRRTADRTLLLNPHEDLGFLQVEVIPNRIDWGVVESIDVHLRHTDRGGAVMEKLLVLHDGAPAQVWKLRTEDPAARAYSYRLVHHLKNGTVQESPERTTTAAAVAVDDPFDGALELEFIPLYDADSVERVYIDVEYADLPNSYTREERLELAGDAVDPVKLRISLLDPTQRLFRYRLTFVVNENGRRALQRGPFIATTEPLVEVAPA